MKKWRVISAVLLCLSALFFQSNTLMAQGYQSEIEYIDAKMPDSQRELVHQYAKHYHISEEVLQSLIFCESSYQMSAVNEVTGCYGIAQINPGVWGYEYNTEEKQIKKACEMLISFINEEPDIAYSIARFNGQSYAYQDYLNGTNTEDEFVSKVLRISYDLETLHGKHNY